MDEDVLSWEKFYEESKKRRFYPPKKAELFNRLIAHTNNFFAISAIGAFSKGYVLVITKKLLPSYALVDQNQIEELNWFINVLTKSKISSIDPAPPSIVTGQETLSLTMLASFLS